MTAQPTVWQQNAAQFATTTTEWGDQERRLGVVDAMESIRFGHPKVAYYRMLRSLRKQALAAGCGQIDVDYVWPADDGVRHVVVVPRFDRRTGGVSRHQNSTAAASTSVLCWPPHMAPPPTTNGA